MINMIYWSRWIFFIPVVIIIYIGFQFLSYSIVIPYLHDMIIDDSPATYEVSSHLFWWIVYIPSCIAIGTSSAYATLKSAYSIAPSHKTQAIYIASGLLLINVLAIFIWTITSNHNRSIDNILPMIVINSSAGLAVFYYVFSKRGTRETKENTPNKALDD